VKRLTILNCTTRFYSPSYTFIVNLINKTIKDNHNVKVFTKKVIRSSGLDVFDVSLDNKRPVAQKLQRKLNALSKRVQNIDYKQSQLQLEKLDPDIIHCHFGVSAHYAFDILKYSNVSKPIVVSLHGYDVFLHNTLGKQYKDSLRALSSLDNVIFTVPSEYLRQKAYEFLGLQKNKVVTVYNSFDENLFHKDTRVLEPGDTYRLVNVSRFVDWKGQKYLLEALVKIVDRFDIHVDFIGDGEELQNCISLSEKLGLSNVCSFHGALPPDKVASIVGDCHLYVHTAIVGENGQTETFGISILEAIAKGKPAIFFDVGGISEVFGAIKSPLYVSVEEKSAEDLSDEITKMAPRLKKLDAEELGRVRETVVKLYSEERYVNSIYNIYEKLINEPSDC